GMAASCQRRRGLGTSRVPAACQPDTAMRSPRTRTSNRFVRECRPRLLQRLYNLHAVRSYLRHGGRAGGLAARSRHAYGRHDTIAAATGADTITEPTQKACQLPFVERKARATATQNLSLSLCDSRAESGHDERVTFIDSAYEAARAVAEA